jgi:anti-sigma-K factor RskA
MDPKEIEELLPFYALDALSEESRQRVESYLAANPEARTRLDELTQAVSAIPYGIPPVEPPRRVKDELMRRIRADSASAGIRSSKEDQPSRRELRFDSLLRTLSFGAALAAILWAVILNIQMSRLENQVSLLTTALEAQSNSLQEISSRLSQPAASSVVTVSLSGTAARPEARGQLIADPKSTSAVLVIAGLGQLEAGKIYQVWLIDSSGPQSAGLLAVDSSGQAVLIITSDLEIGQFDKLGVSIEPDGGSPQPTGEIVVLSDL